MPATGRPRRLVRQAPGPLLLTASFAAQAAGALWPHVPLLVMSVITGLAVEAVLHGRQRQVVAALAKVRADAALRQLLRDVLLVAGLLSLDGRAAHTWCLPLVYGLLCCYVLHFTGHAVALLVRRSRALPVVTRNIDASGLGLSVAPPALLLRRHGVRVMLFGLPATAGLLVTAVMGTSAPALRVLGEAVPGYAAVGIALSAACGLTGLGVLLPRLLPGRRPPGDEEVLAWFDSWLAAYRPTVGLYFSGGSSSAYQADMWLGPLARLDGRPVIVLRERFMVQKLAATDIPIVCIPKVSHLMRLEHSTLRMLIHPANSGKTSQILRIPTLKHTFVNHGESDKLSSCNPYAKAYDEVWVAGPAARARYALADVGIDDNDVVEIGRPQLDGIHPAAPGALTGPYITVLYAPTWEGWDGNPGNTSVTLAGENLVRALVADPGVRLLYRPHPMTGSVDPRAAEADHRIRNMIDTANAAQAEGPSHALEAEGNGERAGSEGGGRRGPSRAEQAGAEQNRVDGHQAEAHQAEGHRAEGHRAEAHRAVARQTDGTAVCALSRCTAELDRLTTAVFRRAADDMERMLVQGAPAPGRGAAVAAATAAWEAAYWASLPAGRHQIVTGARPALYSCFNEADLLISDVSSVISDYLASGKPYAVANTSGLSEDAFRAAFPTVRAATVLTPDAAQVPLLLAALRAPGPDEWAEARAELKRELLGPVDPPSTVRFAEAVRALCLVADGRRARVAGRTAGGVPGQSGARDFAAVQEPADIPGQQGPTSPRRAP